MIYFPNLLGIRGETGIRGLDGLTGLQGPRGEKGMYRRCIVYFEKVQI